MAYSNNRVACVPIRGSFMFPISVGGKGRIGGWPFNEYDLPFPSNSSLIELREKNSWQILLWFFLEYGDQPILICIVVKLSIYIKGSKVKFHTLGQKTSKACWRCTRAASREFQRALLRDVHIQSWYCRRAGSPCCRGTGPGPPLWLRNRHAVRLPAAVICHLSSLSDMRRCPPPNLHSRWPEARSWKARSRYSLRFRKFPCKLQTSRLCLSLCSLCHHVSRATKQHTLVFAEAEHCAVGVLQVEVPRVWKVHYIHILSEGERRS